MNGRKRSPYRITYDVPVLDPQDWREPVTPEDVSTRNGTIRASQHIEDDQYSFINTMLQRWQDRKWRKE